MIVDAILDRKAGVPYTMQTLRYMYDEAHTFGMTELERAIDSGTEKDVKRELCTYIDDEGYNPEIKKYINSQLWINNLMEEED